MLQKFTPSYPPAYRTEALRALRAGRQPEELARELGISGQSLRNWLKQADLDEGLRKDGLTSAERGELTRLRREVHRLRQEKEVLKKAAVFFAGETNSIR